jgi:hypothetical protein
MRCFYEQRRAVSYVRAKIFFDFSLIFLWGSGATGAGGAEQLDPKELSNEQGEQSD